MPESGRVAFGRTPDGQEAGLYTLANGRLRVQVTDYGGRLVAVEAPDRDGRQGGVLLGFGSAEEYARAGGSFGALLGRCANRIGGGRFTLDGRTWHLATNNGDSTLHGGPRGFGTLLWRVTEATPTRLALALDSPDGDQGFPGHLAAEAVWTLETDTLRLELRAHTDRPTVVNLSCHPYFNLAGEDAPDVYGHELTIHADAFLPTDPRQIPTGEIRPVAGTPFDFRTPTPIGARIRQAEEQLLLGTGYDHCWVLSRAPVAAAPRLAVRARDPGTGRVLEVHTDQPGVQVYTGNKLNGSVVGRGGVIYRQGAGFAVEAQGFPDAPNQPGFPSVVLRTGEEYARVILYRFAVER